MKIGRSRTPTMAECEGGNVETNDDSLWSDADEEALALIDCTDDSAAAFKFELECDKILEGDGPPSLRYRPRYLIVSDLAKQFWCEQQLLYSFSPEVYLFRAPSGSEVSLEEDATVKAVKEKGSDIHTARELEIQVTVPVEVITREDTWAVKLINLRAVIFSFHGGQSLAREIPVFGTPFGGDLLVYGIIDELRYNRDLHSIEALELKTRKSKFAPKKAQQEKDRFQVALYSQMFNELVEGKADAGVVAEKLQLDLSQPLSNGVMSHLISQQSQTHDVNKYANGCTLGDLMEEVLSQIQFLCLIQKVEVEYVHQETQAQICVMEVVQWQDWLLSKFAHFSEWWHGQRGTTGVDIEDCWKCEFCQFSPLCEWREVMAEKMSKERMGRSEVKSPG